MDAKPSPDGSPIPAERGTPATGGLGPAPGTGGLGTELRPSVPPQDLSRDPLVANAPWVKVDGHSRPSLGGIPLLAKLGQGGMGAVYYGIHPRLKIEVAVKVLPFHLAEQNPEMVQRFLREAEIAARVSSEHLVSVKDVNQESGIHYLVMEFVKGQTAGGHLKKLKESGVAWLPEADALDTCIAATEGLAAAHRQNIIHRDIKPDNILIPSGEANKLDFTAAKLYDLGMARGGGGGDSITLSQVAMGTPGYMAPEQAEDAKHARKPADVFSMGATLYALLTGNAPFQGSALLKVLRATIEQPHKPIREVRPDVSMATAQLLHRCLAKKPDARYSDGRALLVALKGCRAGLVAQAVQPAGKPAYLAAQARQPAVSPLPRGERGRGEGAVAPVQPQPQQARQSAPHPRAGMPVPLQLGKTQYIAIAVASLAVLLVVAGFLVGGKPQPDKSAAGNPQDVAAYARQQGLAPAMSLDLGNGTKLELVLIPAGKFMMGSPETAKDHEKDETQHGVTISQPFYMGKYEVTQDQYEAVTGTNPSFFKGAKNPVETVSWEDAREFCKKLSQKTGKTVRLPTEAQWEYACRAGTTTRFYSGDADGDLDVLGWYTSNSGNTTHPVGEKKPNAWGLYDMHGNVWEWCDDWYGEYQGGAATDPQGAVHGTSRVLRGGFWRTSARSCRSAARNECTPDDRNISRGFRLVLAGPP